MRLYLRSFLGFEGLVSLPIFFVGALSLWKDWSKVYLLLVTYSAMTVTTLIPVLSLVLTIPEVAPSEAWDLSSRKIAPGHRAQLLMAHGPFAVIPVSLRSTPNLTGRTRELTASTFSSGGSFNS